MEYKFKTQSPENKELWYLRMGDYDILIEGEQIWSFCFCSVGAVHGLEGTYSTWVRTALLGLIQMLISFIDIFTCIHRNGVLLTLWVSMGLVKLAYKIDLCERQALNLQMKIFIFKQTGILFIQTCIDSSLTFSPARQGSC